RPFPLLVLVLAVGEPLYPTARKHLHHDAALGEVKERSGGAAEGGGVTVDPGLMLVFAGGGEHPLRTDPVRLEVDDPGAAEVGSEEVQGADVTEPPFDEVEEAELTVVYSIRVPAPLPAREDPRDFALERAPVAGIRGETRLELRLVDVPDDLVENACELFRQLGLLERTGG